MLVLLRRVVLATLIVGGIALILAAIVGIILAFLGPTLVNHY